MIGGYTQNLHTHNYMQASNVHTITHTHKYTNTHTKLKHVNAHKNTHTKSPPSWYDSAIYTEFEHTNI